MAQKKKNANYSSEKKAAKTAEREAAKAKEKRDKNIKIAAYLAAGVAAFVAVLFGIMALCGVFNYSPEATNHASVMLDNGYSFHIELYGHEAPETVEHFIELCEEGYFDGKSLHTLIDGMLYGGSVVKDGGENGIKGEFTANGHENKVPMKKGVIALARGDENDSGYGQFFILTKNNSDLEGRYAAFGKITDLDVLKQVIESLEVSSDGTVENAPCISSISFHDAHGH